jgi:hypothetical protein
MFFPVFFLLKLNLSVTSKAATYFDSDSVLEVLTPLKERKVLFLGKLWLIKANIFQI